MDGNELLGTAALIRRLKNHWSDGRVKIRPGVSRQQIEEFESQYNVRMPLDLREYFASVDGTEKDTCDSKIFSFLRLEAVRSLTEVLGEYVHHHENRRMLPEPDRWFVIVDYCISAEIFAIRLSAVAEGNPFLRFCDGYEIVAPSFSGFLETYLSNPLTLL